MTFYAQDVQPSGDLLTFTLSSSKLSFGPSGNPRPTCTSKWTPNVKASDSDTGVYKITLGSYGHFNRATGGCHSNPLDYETGSVITSTLTATDLNGASDSITFTVTLTDVPEPPVQYATLSSKYAVVGDPAYTVDLTKHFYDGDGDTMTFTATSDGGSAVKAAVDGSMLTITYSSAGHCVDGGCDHRSDGGGSGRSPGMDQFHGDAEELQRCAGVRQRHHGGDVDGEREQQEGHCGRFAADGDRP